MTYHLTTFGCQMNYSDSERIATLFESLNLKPASEAEADILVFNLCSVRQHALDRIWGLIQKVKRQKATADAGQAKGKSNEKNKNKNSEHPEQKIILTGCILPADKKKFAEREILVLDIKELSLWPKIVPVGTGLKPVHRNTRFFTPLRSVQDDIALKNYFSITPKYFSKFTAFVPIMTGCNNFCSYCAVPYTRGAEYSRPVAEILKEGNNLIVQGYKEIILLGQNVNSYSSQFPISKTQFPENNKKIIFSTLLKMIDSIPGDYWLSFLTSHPKDMTDELINCFQECEHLIPYLHLPLQSGSDKILKAMNRKYTSEHYENLIRKIRLPAMQASLLALRAGKKFVNNSHFAISTDLIVGFPGETKTDFLDTAKAMKKIKFDMAYLAEYSPRPGTVAAKLKDNVSSPEKDRRKKALNEILKKTSLENNKKMVGKIVDVLVYEIKPMGVYGRTNMMKNVKINTALLCHPDANQDPEKKNLIGQFIKVKITKANVWNLEGEIIEKMSNV